jgi:hypothetical protein
VPPKGFPLRDLKARKIDFTFFPDSPVVGGKIITDNPIRLVGA